MKFDYSTKVRLCISSIEPEELESVMRKVSHDGYGPDVTKVYPEYDYDCEGYPWGKLGTYCVEIETQWYGSRIKNGLDRQYNELVEIEKGITK